MTQDEYCAFRFTDGCRGEHVCGWVEVPPSPGSDRTEWEVWPRCRLMYYGGNGMFARDVDKKGDTQ